MQHGESHLPIVVDLKGHNYHRRSARVTLYKKAAHRAHRHRVKQDLRKISDLETFDGAPHGAEACDSWRVF